MKQLTAIAYMRVSTKEQGKSGLGLEAQLNEIKAFCLNEGIELVSTFEEIETGKGVDALAKRPKLKEALKCAEKGGHVLMVAKLDRLGRNVAFISGLMESKARFVVTSLGLNADNFTLHLYAALGEKERDLISQRTKAALQVLKAKGVVLGNQTNLEVARAKAAIVNKKKADDFAMPLLSIINNFSNKGLSLRGIAKEFNNLSMVTARGGSWYASTVSNILKRQ